MGEKKEKEKGVLNNAKSNASPAGDAFRCDNKYVGTKSSMLATRGLGMIHDCLSFQGRPVSQPSFLLFFQPSLVKSSDSSSIL